MAANDLSDFVKDKRTLDRILSKPLSVNDEKSLQNPLFPPAIVEGAKISICPLNSARTFKVHVYEDDAGPPAYSDAPSISVERSNWQSNSLLSLNGDGKSLVIDGQYIEEAQWNVLTSTLYWSSQSGSFRNGSLVFTEDGISALGVMHSSDGKEMLAAMTRLSYYATKYYKDGQNPDTAEDFATLTFDAVPPEVGKPLEARFLLHFKPGQLPEKVDGGEDDISLECSIDLSHEVTDHLLVRKDLSVQHKYAFEITFDTALESFSGSFQCSSGEKYHWIGQHAHSSLQKTLTLNYANTSYLSTSSFVPLAKSVTVGENSDDPPAYTSYIEVEQKAKADGNPNPSLNLQGLLHLSSLVISQTLLPDGKSQDVVKDYAQEQANKCYEHILIGSLPEKTRKDLFPQFLSLSEDEKKIRDRHADYFDRAAIPFLATYILHADSVYSQFKERINAEKVFLFFKAVGSFKEENDDPVKAMGWDRKSDFFKNLQKAYVGQLSDMYRLGYVAGVPTFQPYLDNPKYWHDALSKYLTSKKFLARWALQNSIPGYTSGRRQIYEWMAQLENLQLAAEALGLRVDKDSVDVIESLCSAVLLPSFFEVNWTEEMKRSFKLQLDSIMQYTKDDLDKMMLTHKANYDKIIKMRQLVLIHGSTDNMALATDLALQLSLSKLRQKKLNANLLQLVQIADEHMDPARVPQDAALAAEVNKNTWKSCLGKIGKGVFAFMLPFLFFAGAALMVRTVCNDKEGILSPLEKAQQITLSLEFSLWGIKAAIQSKFGDWLRSTLLNRKSVTKVLGEWFTEKGVASVQSKGGKVLTTLLGDSCDTFLTTRLGPALAILAVCVTGWQVYRAYHDGTTQDLVFASLNCALAVFSALVVCIGTYTTGYIAQYVCGPAGLVLLVLGIILIAVEYFMKPDTSVASPLDDFTNGPLKDHGFCK